MADLNSAIAKGQRKINNTTQEEFCRKQVEYGVPPSACARNYQNWKASMSNWGSNYAAGIRGE